jgi:hypothetical protein
MMVYTLLMRLQPWIGLALIRLPSSLLASSPTLLALAVYPTRERLPTNLRTWAEWDHQPDKECARVGSD